MKTKPKPKASLPKSVNEVPTHCGFREPPFPDNWFNETKRMVAKAYKAWEKRRGIAPLPKASFGFIPGLKREAPSI